MAEKKVKKPTPGDVFAQYGLGALSAAAGGTSAQQKSKAETDKQKASAAAAAAELDADALAAKIIANATSADPTATGTVSPNVISPITGKPTGNSATAPVNPYTATSYSADFMGAGGNNPGLTSVYSEKTKTYYIAKVDQYGVPHKVQILGDPNDPTKYSVNTTEQAIRSTIAEYQQKPGGIASLKQLMWQKGALTGAAGKKSIAAKNEIDPTFVKSLISYLDEVTATNFNNSNTKQFQSFGAAITGATSFAGTRTSYDTQYTDSKSAATDISAFVKEYLGRGATAKEVSDYQAALKKAEKEHPSRQTTTTDALGQVKNRVGTGGGLSQEEKDALKVAVVSKALTAKGVDPSAISKSGGKIAIGMDVLRQTAADYGLQFNDTMALNAMINTVKIGGDIKGEQEKLKQLAKVQYKHLASAIDSGVTIKDVADQFNQYKNRYLETAGPTDVFDKDINAALTGNGTGNLMSINDFITRIKQKPEWANTQNAREDAASFATTILKQFGLLG